jgi:prepilin-type N-terminal cleavage/methylation domain-containing protein
MKTKPRQSGSSKRPSRLGLAETERPCRSSGLTLTEMVVVVSIIAVFTVLGLPAIRAFVRSVESGSSARAMISGALSSARAIAAKQQRYAGVRFQNKYQQDGKGCQYMIFIVQDPEIMAYGFRAVEGLQPIKLPDSVGVMDLRIRTNLSDAGNPADQPIDIDSKIDDPEELRDTTTFSIVFSPSGKLVIHDVRVRNRNGKANNDNSSKDDIFNTKFNVEDEKIAMFYQDDYADLGLGQEPSRNSFIIYDKTVFEKLDPDSRYDDYLKELAAKEVIYINPYTGTMINK